MKRALWAPYAALLVVQLAFATLPIAGKHVLEAGVTPLVLTALRVFLAAVVLAAIAMAAARERVPVRDLWRLAGLSLLGVTLNISLFLEGLDRTTPINAGVLIATIPIFTLLVAVLMRHEPLHGLRFFGIAMALGGTLVALRVDDFNPGDEFLLGNLLVVLNCLSYSFYLVLVKPLLIRYRSSTVVAWTFLFGALALAPIGSYDLAQASQPQIARMDVMFAILWIVLVPSVLSYSLNNFALKRVRPSTVAGFVPLQPIATALLTLWLRPDDTFELRTLVAALLIIPGVVIVGRTEHAATKPGTGKPIKTDPGSTARGRPQPEPEEIHP